jgi:membrane-associated phospholipid phosphatase
MMRALARRAVGACWLAAALAMPKLREAVRVPRALALAVVAGGPPAAAVALPKGRVRDYGTFLAQMWAYFRAFELTYAYPDKLRRRLRVDYPIRADRALGLGTPPGPRLQRLRRRPRLRPVLDRGLGTVYFVWALERHVVLLYVLAKHRERFARAATLVAASFDVGWAIYSAVPTAPPWWAAKHGHLEGLHRVTVDASRALPLVPEENEDDSEQGNPWASMPSTHTSSAVMVALVALEADRRVGAAAVAYAACLGVALVYLGEHYAVDVAAGMALSLAIYSLTRTVTVPARKPGFVARALCLPG